MKTFKVFSHPTQGYEAVKVGVSWPAFFFTFIWLLIKKLWGFAGLWFLGGFILTIIENVADSSPQSESRAVLFLLIAAGWFTFAFLPLFMGNKWRESNLVKRGYDLVSTVEAATPDAAVAQVAKSNG